MKAKRKGNKLISRIRIETWVLGFCLIISTCIHVDAQAQSKLVIPAPAIPAPAISAPPIPTPVIPSPVSAIGVSTGAAKGDVRITSQTLRQLGAVNSMTLRGADGRDGIKFNVRSDEVISKATLKLVYGFSPSLLADGSQLNVLINGDVAASIPVDKSDAGKSLERTLELPVRLISDYNQLTLQLIGRTSLQCEDPTTPALWATISNKSVLELTSAAIALPDDLGLLPAPFMDHRDARSLTLPFVFVSEVDNSLLEAAGTLSSWFGALSGTRGARFPVALKAIPASGSAVVLIAAAKPSLPGVDIAALTGPTISVVTNPSDPFGKLLLVMGRDPAELKRAARALALGSDVLSGQTVTITSMVDLIPRQPYDAPGWLSSTRPVEFGEINSAQSMNVSGYDPGPIRVNMRVPPDLYSRKATGVPVSLKYRYTPQPDSKNASLNIDFNDQLVKSLFLFPIDRLTLDTSWFGKVRSRVLGDGTLLAKLQADETQPMVGQFRIPLAMLYPRSQMQLRYHFDYIKTGECGEIIIDNMRGAIEPSSTIDISGYSHFIAMPDLHVFHTSGFPFTRLADLSQTAVVLPNLPSLQEYETFLGLMGRMGESTGYPGTSITVTQADGIAKFEDKDLLLIASGANQPLFKEWASALPSNLVGTRRFVLSDLVYQAQSLIYKDPSESMRRARADISFNSTSDGALIVGFESPLKSGRSAVLVWGVEAQGLRDAMSAMAGGEDYDRQIEGNLVWIHAKKIEPLLAEQTYQVGNLGFIEHSQWILSHHLGLYVLVGLLCATLLAIIAFVFLRALAGRRTDVANGVKRDRK